MLGANTRNRVKQSALVVSDTEFTLFGGVASDGHRDFFTAFDQATGANQLFRRVPLLIETAEDGSGQWQTAIGELQIDTSLIPDTVRVHTLTVYDTSTGAALALTPGATVYVSCAPVSQMFNNAAIEHADGLIDGTSAGCNPFVANGGKMAVGEASYAESVNSVAVGARVKVGGNSPGAVAFGEDLYPYMGVGVFHGGNYRASIFTATFAGRTVDERYQMSLTTTGATPSPLEQYADGFGYLTDSFCDAGVNMLTIRVTANSDAGVRKVWKLERSIKVNGDYTGIAFLDAGTKTVVYADGGAAAWDANIVLTGDSFQIEVTGAAATNILWGALVEHFLSSMWAI